MFARHRAAILVIALAACTNATNATTSSTVTRPTTTTSTTTTTTSTTTTTTVPTTTTTVPSQPAVAIPAPRPAANTACPPDIVALVHKHFDRFGTDVADWFVSIVWRESNCRPDVVSPTGCRGLTQTALPLHADLYAALGVDWRTTWMDPDINLAAASLLYASSGARPWAL